MSNLEIAVLRPFDDFIGASSRFQVPDFHNQERWANRVVNNLLYYQSNYFLSAMIIFCIFLFLDPLKVIIGFFVVALIFGAFTQMAENQAEALRFKRNHPVMFLILMGLVIYLILSLMGAVVIFVLGITLPILAILIHASLRLRNMKNKLNKQAELIGIKRTPMGLLLEALGQEQESGS